MQKKTNSLPILSRKGKYPEFIFYVCLGIPFPVQTVFGDHGASLFVAELWSLKVVSLYHFYDCKVPRQLHMSNHLFWTFMMIWTLMITVFFD